MNRKKLPWFRWNTLEKIYIKDDITVNERAKQLIRFEEFISNDLLTGSIYAESRIDQLVDV